MYGSLLIKGIIKAHGLSFYLFLHALLLNTSMLPNADIPFSVGILTTYRAFSLLQTED